MSGPPFQLDIDTAAREWMAAHPALDPRVIAYDIHRCCGGGKICQVKVRELSPKDDRGAYTIGEMDDGTVFLIDRRAAARLPSHFRLTARGPGRLRHLDLDLTGEQWGMLLYD